MLLNNMDILLYTLEFQAEYGCPSNLYAIPLLSRNQRYIIVCKPKCVSYENNKQRKYPFQIIKYIIWTYILCINILFHCSILLSIFKISLYTSSFVIEFICKLILYPFLCGYLQNNSSPLSSYQSL